VMVVQRKQPGINPKMLQQLQPVCQPARAMSRQYWVCFYQQLTAGDNQNVWKSLPFLRESVAARGRGEGAAGDLGEES
ncbi:hypothetical protein ACJEM9_25095, partial [Escherichia coli]